MQLAGPSFGWISASMRETAELSWASMPETECLVFLGTEEAVVQPDAIRRGVERLPNAELVEVEGSHHEILMETPELRGVFWKEFDRFIGV
jgi:lysophospholipase